MSLDLTFYAVRRTNVFDANITHNLTSMADAAGIYKCLWRPEELGIKEAGEMIPYLEPGLAKLKADPDGFANYNSPNGWGMYEHFVPFVERVLAACHEFPDAEIHTWR